MANSSLMIMLSLLMLVSFTVINAQNCYNSGCVSCAGSAWNSICSACQSGYTLTPAGMCSGQCQPGYSYDQYYLTCYSLPTRYNLPGCASGYQQVDSSRTCTSCSQGYFNTGNSTNAVCTAGQTNCYNSGCVSCAGSAWNSICSACQSGYTLTPAGMCSGQCQPGYSYDQYYLTCYSLATRYNLPGCVSGYQQVDSSRTCTSCGQGYLNTGNSTNAVCTTQTNCYNSGCTSCAGSAWNSICSGCNAGYTMTPAGMCTVQCQSGYSYDQYYLTCYSLATRYNLPGCASGYQQVDSSRTCTSCSQGYINTGNSTNAVCTAGQTNCYNSGCISCVGSAWNSICSACQSGYTLTPAGMCSGQCQSGYSYDQYYLTCYSLATYYNLPGCASGYQQVNSSRTCTSCLSGYINNGSQNGCIPSKSLLASKSKKSMSAKNKKSLSAKNKKSLSAKNKKQEFLSA